MPDFSILFNRTMCVESDCRFFEYDCVACRDDEVGCDSGECIESSWVCDRIKDCRDYSDEVNCNNGIDIYIAFVTVHK